MDQQLQGVRAEIEIETETETETAAAAAGGDVDSGSGSDSDSSSGSGSDGDSDDGAHVAMAGAWLQCLDSYGQLYWYNQLSLQTVWRRPAELGGGRGAGGGAGGGGGGGGGGVLGGLTVEEEAQILAEERAIARRDMEERARARARARAEAEAAAEAALAAAAKEQEGPAPLELLANPTWKKARRGSRDEDGPASRGPGNNAAAGETEAVDKADQALFDLLEQLHEGNTRAPPARGAPAKPRKR